MKEFKIKLDKTFFLDELDEEIRESNDPSIFLSHFGLKSIKTDNLSVDYIGYGEFKFSHTNPDVLRRTLFWFYHKLHKGIENVEKLPLYTQLKASSELKVLLDESKDLDYKKLSKEINEGLILVDCYYNSARENLIYKIWKNNDNHQGLVTKLMKNISDEERFNLCKKFYNIDGFKIFSNKRFSFFKNNPYFISHWKENDKVLLGMIINLMLHPNKVKGYELLEIMNNISHFIVDNNIILDKDSLKEINFYNLCFKVCQHKNNYKNSKRNFMVTQSVLKLLRVINVSLPKQQLLEIKLSFFPKVMSKKTIETLEDFWVYYRHHQHLKFSSEFVKIFKIKENFIKDNKDSLFKELNLHDMKRNDLDLLMCLIENGLTLSIEKLYEMINSNSVLFKSEKFISFYKDILLNEKEVHRPYLMSSFGSRYLFQVFHSHNIYWLFNNGILDISPFTGGKIFDITKLKYTEALSKCSSPIEFFEKYNIKTKRVKKAIYKSLWDNPSSELNILMLDNVLRLRTCFPNEDEQKIIPIIECNKILPCIDDINSLIEILGFSMDKIITMSNSNSNSNVIEDSVNMRVTIQIRDTVTMLRNLKYKALENKDDDQGLFAQEQFNQIKKRKFKSYGELHDKLAKISEKLSQKSYSLNQKDILEFDNTSITINNEEYVIKVPNHSFDLIDIGEELDICVGNGYYAKKVKDNQSRIFILEKNNKPFVCVEISSRGRNVMQAYMRFNENFPHIRKLENKHPLLTRKKD